MSDDYNGDIQSSESSAEDSVDNKSTYTGDLQSGVYGAELRLRGLEQKIDPEHSDEYEAAVEAVTELRKSLRPESYFGNLQ